MAQVQTSHKAEAAKVYERIMVKGKNGKRADVIAELIDKVGMTKSGASTYYANFKSGAWDVKASMASKPRGSALQAAATKPAAKAKPATKAAAKPAAKKTAAKSATA